MKSHWRTASSAARANSGCTSALSTRTVVTVPSRPIKASIGKIVVKSTLADAIEDYGFSALPITLEHADAVRGLPAHHKDPFDRMLMAQALLEDMWLASNEDFFSAAGVKRYW